MKVQPTTTTEANKKRDESGDRLMEKSVLVFLWFAIEIDGSNMFKHSIRLENI